MAYSALLRFKLTDEPTPKHRARAASLTALPDTALASKCTTQSEEFLFAAAKEAKAARADQEMDAIADEQAGWRQNGWGSAFSSHLHRYP